MDTQTTKTPECEYKEYDSLITEQFICGLDNEGMIDEILRKVPKLEDIEDAMSEY